MKENLQKEILEKVKPGTKPSDIRKLKRSKSDGDIPLAPPLPSVPLNRSKSTEPSSFSDQKYPYTTLIAQSQEIEQLKEESKNKSTTISLLRKKIEELEKSPPTPQKLDNALIARHQNLKDWFSQYQKSKKLDKELAENVNQASDELITQDQTISKLRTEIRQLKQSNQSLTKDLELAQRAVKWRQSLSEARQSPLPLPENYPFLKYALTFGLIGVFLWLCPLKN